MGVNISYITKGLWNSVLFEGEWLWQGQKDNVTSPGDFWAVLQL